MTQGLVYQGNENFGDIASGRLREDKRFDFYYMYAKLAPFARFTQFLPRGEKPKQETITWYNTDYFPSRITIANSGDYTAGITTLKVGASYYENVVVGDIIQNPLTREIMRVTGNDSTDSITVTRSIGSTAAATIDKVQHMLILGNISKESGGIPEAKQMEPITGTNYITTVKKSYKVSGRADRLGTVDSPGAQKLYERRKAEKMQEFLREMEFNYFFGEKAIYTSGDDRYTYMGGVEEFIRDGDSRTVAMGGAITWAGLESLGLTAFENMDTDVLWGFTSPLVLSTINQMMYAKVTLNQQDTKSLGVDVQELKLSGGTVKLIEEPWFKLLPHNGYLFLLDKRRLKRCETVAPATVDDVQGKDVDYRNGYHWWEGSIQIDQTDGLTLATGITGLG